MLTRRAAILVAASLAVAACGGTPTPTPSTPGASAEVTVPPTVGPVASGEVTPPPTEAPATEAPATETPGATPEGTVGPSESVAPSVDSLKIQRTADCNGDNGTGTVGWVKITWTASGTTGVRISIDPPSPDTAYGYGYGDYPASGSANVPFACDPPNHDANGDYHLYVVTTIHDKGYFYWRYAKVYQVATPG